MRRNKLSSYYAPYACILSKEGRIIKEDIDKNFYIRTDFQRDRDRIIHSSSFRKLKHKTQVFIFNEGDYYRTRLTHSLEVAQIARTISRSMNLNEDYAETVALAHDLGHPPFGHAGENVLNNLMKKYDGFNHNEQTIRLLTNLEERYANFDGLNLTIETLEGIIKHNGPIEEKNISKTVKILKNKCNLFLSEHAPLEAQIANMSDDIAYLSHDFDDCLRAKLINLEQIKDLPLINEIFLKLEKNYGKLSFGRILHELRRNIINFFVQDIIRESVNLINLEQPKNLQDVRFSNNALISHSREAKEIINKLKNFLHINCWKHYKVNRIMNKSNLILEKLFNAFFKDENLLPTEWQNKIKMEKTSKKNKARIISDYIASMTDRYAIIEYNNIF